MKRLFTFVINGAEKMVTYLEKKWEAHHPPTFNKYNLFSTAMKSTFKDFHQFAKLRKRLVFGGETFSSFTRAELVIYRQVPKDMLKLTPAVIVTILPGSLILLPLFFAFPRKLLTRRFWNDSQKHDFSVASLTAQLSNHDKVVSKMGNIAAKENNRQLLSLVDKITGQSRLQEEEILILADTFEKQNLCLSRLSYMYQLRLRSIQSIGMISWMGQRHSLKRRAALLSLESRALLAEGLHSLVDDELIIQTCLDRGGNAYAMSKQERLDFIESWCKLASQVSVDNASFVLHLPTLVAFTHPANLELRMRKSGA